MRPLDQTRGNQLLLERGVDNRLDVRYHLRGTSHGPRLVEIVGLGITLRTEWRKPLRLGWRGRRQLLRPCQRGAQGGIVEIIHAVRSGSSRARRYDREIEAQ